MKFIVEEDYAGLSTYAAGWVVNNLLEKPDALLVLPTGNTPLGMFRALVDKNKKNEVDFSRAVLVELDEYYGISLDDRRNLFNWLEQELLDKLTTPFKSTLRFNSAAENPETEPGRMEREIIGRGGIDFLVLGIGPNGHLGFNEPGDPLLASSRIMQLTQASIRSSARYWGGEDVVPKKGFTLGIDVLSRARHTLLLASGEEKAKILAEAVAKHSDPSLPASYLHVFPDVTVCCYRAAARFL